MTVKKQARSGQGSVVMWRPAVLNPDGSIRRQPLWRARISMGTANGRRLRKYLYATSERAVLEKLDKALRAQHKGELAPGRRIKVDDYLRKWLVSTKDRVRPATYEFYRQRLAHVIPALTGRYLDSLMAADVEEMLGKARSKSKYGRSDNPLSVKGKQHIRAVLRNALRDAQRSRLVATNAAADARLRGASRPEVLILDPEQSRTFLAAAAGSTYEPIYLMALFLGMRQGELLGLQWEDIDWISRTINVRHGLQRVDGTLTLVDTKSASSRRSVPMPDVVRRALIHQRERVLPQRFEAMLDRELNGPDHPMYVFVTTRGRPHSARNLVRDFKAILKKAGLPEIRFHDLRHSCNSLLASMGVSARDRAQLLGHSDVRLTENVYTHPLPASLRNAVDGLATILELPLKREAQ